MQTTVENFSQLPTAVPDHSSAIQHLRLSPAACLDLAATSSEGRQPGLHSSERMAPSHEFERWFLP